jgi:hypothetical protein
MKIIESLPDPSGLYVLTAEGQLGYYDETRQFHLDRELSEAFVEHNWNYLQTYRNDPGQGRFCTAIVYASGESRPWGAVTLFFEEYVVRELYPVGGPVGRELTAFQKKNREKSIYRGMELLLEHRSDLAPKAPMYCPVLFDRRTTLDQYAPNLGRPVMEGEGQSPVIEVLNLVATIPVARRETPALLALKEKLHCGLIRKDRRRASDLEILEGRREQWEPQASAEDAYADVDKRAGRMLTLSEKDLERLHQTQRYEQVEQWLEIPHRAVDPGRLRNFVHFRDMDPAKLSLLASRSLIYTAPAGARLLDRGLKDSWNMFLLEGTVSLAAEDGAMLTVEGGSEKAANPVAFLKPRKYTVSAMTKVSFLWIHDVLLKVVMTSGRQAPLVSP